MTLVIAFDHPLVDSLCMVLNCSGDRAPSDFQPRSDEPLELPLFIRRKVLLQNRTFKFHFLVILLLFPCLVKGQQWSGILATSRATDWTQAGISGGIPSGSWTQCGSTISAYGSSGSYASPSTIVNAVAACSGQSKYVLLGAGDFYLNSSIHLSGYNNVELRGSGPQATRLHFNGTATCAGGFGSCFVDFASSDTTYAGGVSTAYNWTSGYSQGATSITLASSTNIQVGTMLVLDQCDTGYSGVPCAGSAVDNGNFFNCEDKYVPSSGPGCSENGPENTARPHRGQEEAVQVVSCSPSCNNSGSTTVTISHPLIHPNWTSGQSPQVWYIQPSQYVGMQGFSIDGSGISYSGLTFGTAFYNLANFWQRNVSLTNFANTSTYVWQSMNGDIESNYYYGIGQLNPSNDASGINYLAFDTLIANNIFQTGKIDLMPSGQGAGNVIAYNVAINAFTGDDYLFGTIWTGHSNGSDYNLYEGNYTPQLLYDQTHGSQLSITAYRNFFPGFESCANGNCGSATLKHSQSTGIQDSSNNRYENIIANVIGTPGVSTLGYTYTNASYGFYNGNGQGYAYNMGSGNQGISNPIPVDPYVVPTSMRWGNWDAFNGSTQWNASEVPSGISVYANPVPTSFCTSSSSCPPSFYYSGRPTWWSSSIPFPAIGPDVSGGNVGQCSGTIGTPGQQAGTAATSSSQCTGTSLKTAWGGHVNATPAMACYLNVLGGLPDGTGPSLAFDATTCYGAKSAQASVAPLPPSGLAAVVD